MHGLPELEIIECFTLTSKNILDLKKSEHKLNLLQVCTISTWQDQVGLFQLPSQPELYDKPQGTIGKLFRVSKTELFFSLLNMSQEPISYPAQYKHCTWDEDINLYRFKSEAKFHLPAYEFQKGREELLKSLSCARSLLFSNNQAH